MKTVRRTLRPRRSTKRPACPASPGQRAVPIGRGDLQALQASRHAPAVCRWLQPSARRQSGISEASLASTTQLFSPVTKSRSQRLANDLPASGLVARSGLRGQARLVAPRFAKANRPRPDPDHRFVFEQLAASLSGLPLNHGRDWAYLRIGSETCSARKCLIRSSPSARKRWGYANETCGRRYQSGTPQRPLHLEECRRFWIERDRELNDDVLMHLATTSPAFEALIDPAFRVLPSRATCC